jgi:hypothetical protein
MLAVGHIVEHDDCVSPLGPASSRRAHGDARLARSDRDARRDRQSRWGPSAIGPLGLLVAALVGTWVGHELEYLRVWGSAQFPNAMVKTAHAYFGPVGAVLLILGVLAVQASLRLARRLERRVARLHSTGLDAATELDSARVPPGWTLSFPALVAILWTLQLVLYVTQENLEAHAFHLPAPGLGAVTGIHAWAPVVHLGVAFGMACVVWVARRRVTVLVAEVRFAEAMLALRGPRRLRLVVRRRLVRAWTPKQRWGVVLWARPPPRSIA